MLNLLKNLPLVQLNKLILFTLLVLISACEKDPALSGGGAGDNLETVDSLVLSAYTIADEPRNSLNEGDVALGRLTDPRFGESLASFYMQLRLGTTSFEPGTNAVLDSAVLVLDIEDTFGPLANSMDIEVYRLTEELDAAENYISNLSLTTDVSPIGGLNGFVYNNNESLRIPMTNAFGDELLGLFGSTTTESNDEFLTYLNGLYLTVNPTTGGDGLLDVELTSELTSLMLYFSSDSPEDSLYSFSVGTSALRVNQYQNDDSGSELEVLLNDLNNDDESILLGGLQVSKGIMDLPDLSFLEGAVINQAKLTFYQADYGDVLNTDYDNPDFLLVTGGKTTDTIQFFLSDYLTSDPTAYGGIPELVDVDGNPTIAYSYNIPRFIQRYVDGATELTFLNVEVVNFNNGNRVKLGGGSHPNFPISLEILYTKP
ncbi:MAG: hypothetical protein ACI9O4_000782 [Chitinophagales bacterium]|jgi:hypothetical protein